MIFDKSDKIYDFHFPGNPVVPGALIIGKCKEIIEKEENCRISKAEKFRFGVFVKPDKCLLKWVCEGKKIKIILEQFDKKAVSGVFYAK